MGFLISKILLLLAMAAACGGLFTYWWFRRHYQDVTVEYLHARDEWADWRARFEERLAARPEVDLGPLSRQLATLEEAVRALDAAIARRIGEIRMPELPAAPDLTTVEERLMAIEHSLFPVQTRLDELESAVRTLRAPAAAPAVDFAPVLERLGALESRLESPPAAAAPMGGVREGSLNLLPRPAPGQPTDLTQNKGVA